LITGLIFLGGRSPVTWFAYRRVMEPARILTGGLPSSVGRWRTPRLPVAPPDPRRASRGLFDWRDIAW